MKFAAPFAVGVLSACSTTTGVVPIGDGIYMASKQDGAGFNWSSGKVKAELYQEAAQYCSKLGKKSIPLSDIGQDSSMYSYASAEISFAASSVGRAENAPRCVGA